MLRPDELVESPFKGKTGTARIVQAIFNSLAGLQDAWRCESAFRQEVVAAIVMVPIAFVVPVSTVERALLVVTIFLVLIVELLNSSVEAAIDRISLEHHPLSKHAKDVGSAAVLMALALLGTVWLLILVPRYL